MPSHRNIVQGTQDLEPTAHAGRDLSLLQIGRLLRNRLLFKLQLIGKKFGAMAWLSGSPFRAASPDTQYSEPHQPFEGQTMSLSHILALRDGATGTIPLTHQHSLSVLLKADVPRFIRMVPRILWSEVTRLATRQASTTWRDNLEGCAYVLLSILEIQLVLSAIPIWVLTPGVLGLPLLLAQVGLIWGLIRVINWKEREFVTRAEPRKRMMFEDWDLDSWAVVGGMSWTEDQLRTRTSPRLAQLFGHNMHVFLPYRLGFLLDLAVMLAQRTLEVPTPLSLALYKHVRAHCVQVHAGQLNIIVHNTGALDMAWVMARLCSDLPPGQLMGRFNVYTFGAATTEMTVPLGAHSSHEGHGCNCETTPEYPQVTHYAFGDDPFAKIGVLLGVWHRMQGRLVGAVYVIQQQHTASWRSWMPRARSYSLDDYLDVLFPDGNPRAGVLGQVCRIECDVSVMRELAALANAGNDSSPGSRHSRASRHSRTLSGASCSSGSDHRRSSTNMAGLVALEEARRIGKASEGMRGYENNALAALVAGKYRLSEYEQRGVRRRSIIF